MPKRTFAHSICRAQTKSSLLFLWRHARQTKGPGKQGHIVADTNVSPFARVRNICCGHKLDTNFVSGTQKMLLILFRNILCPQQMFPSMRSPRNIMGNNVSSFTRALRKYRSLPLKSSFPWNKASEFYCPIRNLLRQHVTVRPRLFKGWITLSTG